MYRHAVCQIHPIHWLYGCITVPSSVSVLLSVPFHLQLYFSILVFPVFSLAKNPVSKVYEISETKYNG